MGSGVGCRGVRDSRGCLGGDRDRRSWYWVWGEEGERGIYAGGYLERGGCQHGVSLWGGNGEGEGMNLGWGMGGRGGFVTCGAGTPGGARLGKWRCGRVLGWRGQGRVGIEGKAGGC